MSTRRIALALFDWDGVVCDSLDVFHEHSRAQWRNTRVERAALRLQMLRAHKRGEAVLPGRLADYARAFAACPLFPGFKALLPALRASGVRIAVVSTSPRATIELLLRRHRLAGVVHAIYSSDSRYRKPDPRLLRVIASRFRVPEEDTVFAGDQISDVALVAATRYHKHFSAYGFHPESALRHAIDAHGAVRAHLHRSSVTLCRAVAGLAGLKEEEIHGGT